LFQAFWVSPALSVASAIDGVFLKMNDLLKEIESIFNAKSARFDERTSQTLEGNLAAYVRGRFMAERVFRSENLRTGFPSPF
jgi:hypothetical protein